MRAKRFLMMLLAVMLLLMTGVAAAQDTGVSATGSETAPVSTDGQYYQFSRLVDLADYLNDEDHEEISGMLMDFLRDAKLDLQIYIIPSVESFGCADVYEFAERYYDDPKYPAGYGADRSALFYIFETDKSTSELLKFGPGSITTWGLMKGKFYADYYMRCGNAYDACRGLIDRVWNDLNRGHSVRAARTDMMNEANFHPYHNEKISRMLDFCGIFGQSELDALETRLTEIREKYQMDIVVLVAPDSDGKTWEEFADDFYDYVGFGYGDEYDGMILFVDMDSADRGYTITTCGTRGQNTYNSIVETIYDDMLDAFKAGKYYEGINVYVNHAVRRINHMERTESFLGISRNEIKVSTDDDRVVDPDEILKNSVKKNLEKTIKNIRKEFGTDVLVLAVRGTGDYYPSDYLYNYYTFLGYGEGSRQSGIGLILVDEDTEKAGYEIVTFGNASGKFDESALNRLKSMVGSALGSDRYDKAAQKFVDKTKFRLKWGHYPMTTGMTVVVFLIVFAVISIIASIKKAANKTVAKAVTASEYIVPGSYRVFNIQERFINSKVTKTRRVESSSSGRSGGGGGSHYSSSGRSHGGGGGRHF